MVYGSAEDLPQVKQMRRELTGLRLLRFLAPREVRAELTKIPEQLRHMTETVDGFYALLGPKHWIFHEDLTVDDMSQIVAEHKSDPEAAERALIDWYAQEDRLTNAVRRQNGVPALRERMHLLQLAVADYEAERYYAVVHMLLSVMDGFVNDLDPSRRRGLHAREPEEMDAWNSVVGHHQGLTAAHQTFTKSFKARDDQPVHELYRNGIVHGMLTNYDNQVVATKAWNRLFAVADWARSIDAMAKDAAKPPEPSWREVLRQLQANEKTKAALESFVPVTLDGSQPDLLVIHPVFIACQDYLEAWRRKNYGTMAGAVSAITGAAANPGAVRAEYQQHALQDYTITSLDHRGASVCTVDLQVLINDASHSSQLRWVREGTDGHTVLPTQDGSWQLMSWGVTHLLQDGT